MDVAYDHIQEEALSPDEPLDKQDNDQRGLNSEFQEAFKAVSASPWGARLGGFFGTVKKQSESYYEGARQELTTVSSEATRGFTDLRSSIINRTRSLSFTQSQSAPEDAPLATPSSRARASNDAPINSAPNKPDSLPADIVKEAEGMLSRLRLETAARLKTISKAEDAADEALLKFGTNIRNFLRDAVTVAPPAAGGEKNADGSGKVLFESKDAEGKRVIHTTRFDAQLHVIHSSLDSFSRDPASPEFEPWAREFDVEKQTGRIGRDLEAYEELRRAMEKLMPERVAYEEFWKRYYFLRHVIETEEQRRRELLKGVFTLFLELSRTHVCTHVTSHYIRIWTQIFKQAKSSILNPLLLQHTGASAEEEEQVTWDASSSSGDEDDDDESLTPNPAAPSLQPTSPHPIHESTAPQPTASTPTDTDHLKPTAEPRLSHDERSQADSDASYDIVSGATSRAPGSPRGLDKEKESSNPREQKGNAAGTGKTEGVAEESDEEDWE
ncbi:hypothetical protein B0A49_09923 [Cryomyces minteri]|uniref:BSD domain-containing protein n=1 Tax=Cryomyces minteri TaxID=331657 RepID=A0A4U0WFW9_9PEZI|nr:hypothetical protein B0A49_09923 [Cryomyces minteri]